MGQVYSRFVLVGYLKGQVSGFRGSGLSKP